MAQIYQLKLQLMLMRKFPVYAILTGILLVLSSCIHVTYTLHQMASLKPTTQFSLLPHHTLQTQLLVRNHHELISSIYLEFAETDSKVGTIQYSYVFTSNDQALDEGIGIIDRDSTDKNTKVRTVGQTVQVETYLPVLKLTDDNTVLIDMALSEIDNTAAPVLAEARFYLDPPLFGLSFLSLVLLWTLGILLVLVGTIQWTRSVQAPAFDVATPVGEERTRLWLMLCHLSALLGYVLPFGHVFGPLVVWIIKRDQVPGMDAAGRESLNFQLTVTLLGLIGVMLSVVFVGLILLFLVVVFHFCMTLYASVRAQRGDDVTYPLNVRILKGYDSS